MNPPWQLSCPDGWWWSGGGGSGQPHHQGIQGPSADHGDGGPCHDIPPPPPLMFPLHQSDKCALLSVSICREQLFPGLFIWPFFSPLYKREGGVCRPPFLWSIPENTGRWSNVVLMLDQRRRRWSNIKTALVVGWMLMAPCRSFPAWRCQDVRHRLFIWS